MCEEQVVVLMRVEGMTGQQLVITKLSNNGRVTESTKMSWGSCVDEVEYILRKERLRCTKGLYKANQKREM
jgi:hypothetical protein